MKLEERIAKDLSYVLFKNLKDKKKKVKKIIFHIEGSPQLNISLVKNALKKCVSYTSCESAEIVFMYKYDVDLKSLSTNDPGANNIYLHEVEYED
ncbi:MAG: hypothetical protein ABDH23_00680 [Endomicrobiia bacterium]